jgi:hypothetical protein
MSERKVPDLAVRLLQSCGVNPALVGDMAEEFARGRSAAWYWKQTAVAILRCGRVVPGIALATFLGWLVQLPLVYAIWRYLPPALIPFVVAGVLLSLSRYRGRRYLAGSWVYLVADEVADYVTTYLFLAAAIGPFRPRVLVFCEIAWLAAHLLVARRKLRRA